MFVIKLKEMLGSNAVPLQLPIGAEETFKGVVDLVNNRGIVWNEGDMGMTFEEVPIPEDMLDEVAQYRENLLEAIAEFDDTLMEKYFEDPDSITEREILDALREATISGKLFQCYVVLPLKIKVFKQCWICNGILPSPIRY